MNSLILNNPHIHQFIAEQIKTSANDARWDRFVETSAKPERKYRAKMREVFNQQLDEIMSNLNMFKSQKAIDDWLIDWEKYVLLLNEFGQLELPGILSAWANMELEALEVGISFDVLDPKVQTAIEHRANHFADSVVNETRDRLHQVVSDSIGQGDGIPQLEKKIRQLYDNMSKFRATRIARSETIWAQNEGAEWSYIQSGVVQAKQWWTARDERRCFAGNTKVDCINGIKQIKDVKIGDYVKTHNGYKRVINITKTKRTGEMVEIISELGKSLYCTPDHPIYDVDNGWRYASELAVRNKLQTSENEIIKVVDINYIKLFKPYYNITKFFKFFIPSVIFLRVIMPILAITFKTNIESRQKEINRKSVNLKFLNKFNFKSSQRFADKLFNYCFAIIRSVAGKRTKSLFILFARNNTKLFSTFKTRFIDRWSPALLRAIDSCASFIIKHLPACRTLGDSFKAMPAFEATNSITIPVKNWNCEGFLTNGTNFSYHGTGGSLAIAGIRTKTLPAIDFAWLDIKRFSAKFANKFRSFTGRFMITFRRAIFSFWALCFKVFLAKFALHFITSIKRYYNILITWCQSYNVYDIEVEDSHTYFANGVLVHNCPFCAEMHGKILGLEQNYFNLGESLTVPKPETPKGFDVAVQTTHGQWAYKVLTNFKASDTLTYTFSYEDISHPPLHPFCRCVLLPVVELTRAYIRAIFGL